MWNGPCLILNVRGHLFKRINCLEGTEVVVLPPAPVVLEPLDHPGAHIHLMPFLNCSLY